MKEEILASARKMLGIEGEEDDALLGAACDAAIAELEGRLRTGTDMESIRALFTQAAGVVALSMYIAAGGAREVRSFKAGSLSAEFSDVRDADSLRKAGEALLKAHLEDKDFIFRSVRA
ncbi:MAG: phage gp6-like head-tail connector protein [Oscillospiraceae bacterium]|nr:phage gp6-like head-tail connector protein [Oscillospiraceae bacterium]